MENSRKKQVMCFKLHAILRTDEISLRLLRSTFRTNLLFMKLKKEERIRAGPAVAPQTAKVTVTVGDKCLV